MNLFLILLTIFTGSFAQNNDEINKYKKMMEEALKMEGNASNHAIDIRVERVNGSVSILTVNGEEIALTDNYQYPLEAGDMVKTGYDGYANIYINNIGIINIQRNSEFEITDPSSDIIMTLSIGSIVSKIENLIKQKMSLKIKTPQAVIGVRGTEFAIEYSKFSKEVIAGVFDEGEISVYPGESEDENKLIKVSKNMEVSVTPDSKRNRVLPLSRLLKYRSTIALAKKNLLLHKKKWKRFNEFQRQKFRESLFKKKLKERVNHKLKSKKKILKES